ncbi:MAG: hypothetical protein IPM88_20400 [Nitrospira sp.]|nr:hypothetical protein [Nitrospira sp.]
MGTGDPQPAKSGWQAIIKNGAGPDFRGSSVLFPTRSGDEAFRPLKKGDFIPQRDPLTDVHRPVARALNYAASRSADNMQTQHEYFGFEDESMAHSALHVRRSGHDHSAQLPRDSAKFRAGARWIGSVPFSPSARRVNPLAAQPAGDR